jgi:hypothetical protein
MVHSAISRKEIVMHTRQMISSHPRVRGQTNETVIRCIEACYDCAQTSTACADACLGETTTKPLLHCIRLSLDCAEICAVTGSIATRRTETSDDVIRSVLEACIVACRACAEECRLHASHHEHCRICAEACHACMQACREELQNVGGALH